MPTAPSPATASPPGTAPLAYFWGDDAYGLEAALDAFRNDPRRFPDGPPERWRPEAERTEPARLLGEIRERLATGSMFGGGSVAILRGAGGLIRSNDARAQLLGAFETIAPGNGLAIVEETESGAKDPPSKTLADAIRNAGGEVRWLKAPREGELAAWIEARAREREIRLGPGVARELATRVGGFVREGDVERQHQGRIAVMELEKLTLRHAAGRAGDGRRRPGARRGGRAGLDVGVRRRGRDAPARPRPRAPRAPHRRQAGAGPPGRAPPPDPRADRGPGPARARRVTGLAGALDAPRAVPGRDARPSGARLDGSGARRQRSTGLVELDAQVKGVGGRRSTDARDRLAFDLWITDRVAPG